jgi:hypothetical protein
MPQPVIYNYPQAAQGYYPPPMMMMPPAAAPMMMPGLPASVALNPYLSAALGHPAKAPETKPEPEKKGFLGHLYRLIQPENFNWTGNAAAGAIIGGALAPAYAFYQQGQPDNMGRKYYSFKSPDGQTTYRKYMLPIAKLENLNTAPIRDTASFLDSGPNWLKGPINFIVKPIQAAFDVTNGAVGGVNSVYKTIKDTATGSTLAGSSDAIPHMIVKEKPGGLFGLGSELINVAEYDWKQNAVTHFDDAGNKIKQVFFKKTNPEVILFNQAGEAIKKEVYTKTEQGLSGGPWRLLKTFNIENNLIDNAILDKTYDVVKQGGKKVLQEMGHERINSIMTNIQATGGDVSHAVVKHLSEWLDDLPAGTKTMMEKTPITEIIPRIFNLHNIIGAGVVGALVAAGLGIWQQPHHTVVRLGE